MDNSVHFFSEDTPFQLKEPDLHRQWIKNIVQSEGKIIETLNYIFCSDDYLLQINIEYLQHHTFTDIITFPYKEGKTIAGDIFISIDRITENAQTYSSSFEQELLRVMAHGVLHLCGYGDKAEDEITKMREKENAAISLFTP